MFKFIIDILKHYVMIKMYKLIFSSYKSHNMVETFLQNDRKSFGYERKCT